MGTQLSRASSVSQREQPLQGASRYSVSWTVGGQSKEGKKISRSRQKVQSHCRKDSIAGLY
ncbi:hypothetical protein ACHAXR_000899 [Thalassiosira sp. AJA248-18]